MPKPAPNMISELRRQQKLSQQDLATRINAHFVTLSKLETGKARLTFEWAEKIAAALQVDVFRLYERKLPPKQIDFSGSIEDKGTVLPRQAGDLGLAVSQEYYEDPFADWYVLRTNDFFPLLRPGDAVRVTRKSLLIGTPGDEFDRLCLAQVTDSPDVMMFGLLGRSSRNEPILLASNGAPLRSGPVSVIGAVTMVLFTPDFFVGLYRSIAKN